MRRKLIVYFFLILVPFSWLFSQKNQEEAFVLIHSQTSLRSRSEQIRICPDGKGGFYSVWKSSRGEKSSFSLYAQHVNSSGKPLWPLDGLQLTVSTQTQNHHQITCDNDGNLVVVWEEGTSPNTDVYIQKFDSIGRNLWRNPIPVCSHDFNQTKPKILHDYKNQFLVVWEDDRNGYTGKDIYAQLINEYGRALWEIDGIPIVKEPGLQQSFEITLDPGQEFIVVWEDFRTKKTWELYAQKINHEGKRIWDEPGVNILSNLLFNQKNFSIVGDGYGGLICAFEASGLSTAQNDLHTIRINAIGIKVFESVISNDYESQLNPQIMKKGSEAVIFWEDYRNANADLFAQKINLFNGVKVWDSTGVVVCNKKHHQSEQQACWIGNHGNSMVLWLDERYGKSIFAQLISPDGKPLWNDCGILATHSNQQVREFQILPNDDGTLWFVYIEESADGILPRFQKLKNDGTVLFDISGVPLFSYQSSITAKLDELKIVEGKNNDIYFVWKDYRNGELNPDIYLMRTDRNGNPLWKEGGVPICTEEGEQSRPIVIPTNYGALIGWVDRRIKNDENLYLQSIDTAGNIYLNFNGVPLCEAPKSQNDLKIVRAGMNFLCLWTDARNLLQTGFDIYYQLIDSLGNRLLNKNGVPFQASTAYENTPQLLQAHESTYCVWMDDRSMFYNIYCQRLTNKGNPLWRSGGIPIQKGSYHQRHHLLEILPDGSALVLWSDERLGNSYEKLFMQKISTHGLPLWKIGGLEVCSHKSRQVAPKVSVDKERGFIVTWMDDRNAYSSSFNLYTTRISSTAGNTIWNPVGIQLGENLQEDYRFEFGVCDDIVFYCWHQRASSGYEQVYWQAIEVNTGKSLFPAPQAVGSNKRHQTYPGFLHLGNKAFILGWLEKDNYTVEDKILVKKIHLKP